MDRVLNRAKRVYVFLHHDDEVGYIADCLNRQGIQYTIVRGFSGEAIPSLRDDMLGLVFMGGTMSANDGIPWIDQEVSLIEKALRANLPLLGHCLGGQLISKALGQKIVSNPVAEIGWHNCQRDLSVAANDWLGALPQDFIMFHWHFEAFDVPLGGQLLFSSEHCRNQAYVYGDNVLAMQCHVEMTLPILRDWTSNYRLKLCNVSDSEQNHKQIANNLLTRVAELNMVADQLYGRWISTLQITQ
jgi:GMP synthase-like glutamine amidotransferase